MNRRNFLRTSGALSLPALLSTGVAADPAGFFSQFINPDSDKVLVLIRLSGGNDGLNTLIGLDQLDKLSQVRGNIALSASDVIGLNDTTGLHGSMTGMKSLYDEGLLGAVQAVGYPNQNRSHFRSTDIWTSGSASDETETKGWLGRYLELEHAEFPAGYPNEEFPYPLAMTMGNVVSSTCQGSLSNLSVVVNNPFNFLYIAPGGNTSLPNGNYGTEVSYVRELIGQSNQYGAVVQEAANAGNTLAVNYTEGKLSDQLRNIATLIAGGLQTKIYVATLGGFDTHSEQVTGNNRLLGDHANLLTELSDSIKAFMDDLKLLGVDRRVMGLTFSEFGRRIRSNESSGSDHGDAGPLFLFGNCVQGGVMGQSPEIDTAVDQNTGVPFQYDFRDVYGSVLIDWFEVPEATVQTLFSSGFTYLPIANGCSRPLNIIVDAPAALGDEYFIDLDWQDHVLPRPQGFRLERSEDGRNFQIITRVPAKNSVTGYTFRDEKVRKNKLYYYRLQRENTDRTISTSGVQTGRLRGSSRGDWAVGLPRPNPVRDDGSYIKVYAPTDATAAWSVTDISGRKVRNGSISLLGGQDNRIPLRPAGLPNGTYVWQLITENGQRFSRKMLRQ
ncbi:MAG: DUF1501 domain-containing protein [Lewinella sp.]|jgi:uncharacterized protein (DUF1501 family)|nr:DUF1501 domain-containing protein [Lewinella sp.]